MAVIGAGRIGTIRARIAAEGYSELVVVADVDEERARRVAAQINCVYSSDWSKSVSSKRADIVVVSTTNDSLAKVSKRALSAGKHVLVEKPGATSSTDLAEMAKLADKNRVKCKVGFNHRFHPGISRLRELVTTGVLGNVSFVRARHGHGGRPGYEKEWRANPLISGGGELMDQGVHSLDLISWFAPNMERIAAWTHTCFWSMSVEDNALLMLAGADNVNAFLNVSWTQWKPVFSFEVYGADGFAEVNGLGGAYGPETLTHGNRDEGIINRTVFPQQDDSWRLEWDHFLQCIEKDEEPMSSVRESLRVLKAVDAAYLSARNSSRVVSLA